MSSQLSRNFAKLNSNLFSQTILVNNDFLGTKYSPGLIWNGLVLLILIVSRISDVPLSLTVSKFIDFLKLSIINLRTEFSDKLVITFKSFKSTLDSNK